MKEIFIDIDDLEEGILSDDEIDNMFYYLILISLYKTPEELKEVAKELNKDYVEVLEEVLLEIIKYAKYGVPKEYRTNDYRED